MKSRETLDDFVSMNCFKAAIVGMEDILGVEGAASAMIAAGRKRGATVADATGLSGSKAPAATLAKTLDQALGLDGTRLCQVVDVSDTGTGYLVKTKETVCTSNEPVGSQRTCTYTMGAILGFLEKVDGHHLSGKHVANTLSGSSTDDMLFTRI